MKKLMRQKRRRTGAATFATLLHAANVDELTVKWLMGHSTRNDITAHYTHETIAVLRDAVRKIA